MAGTVTGRRVLREWLGRTRVYDSAWDMNERQHAYNEGMREAGLLLLRDLQLYAPEHLPFVLWGSDDV
jgi:hypothetical protein